MPIHFSIGFVVEDMPRRQFETVCATAYIEQEVIAKWVRSTMCCNKSGCCGECVDRQLICIGSGNSKRFLFSVIDSETGDEVDISGADDIIFTVTDGTHEPGGIKAGGDVRILKSLQGGDIVIAGTGYQFIVDIDDVDTSDLVRRDSYWDVTVYTDSGEVYTIKAGVFRVTKTNAGN